MEMSNVGVDFHSIESDFQAGVGPSVLKFPKLPSIQSTPESIALRSNQAALNLLYPYPAKILYIIDIPNRQPETAPITAPIEADESKKSVQ